MDYLCDYLVWWPSFGIRELPFAFVSAVLDLCFFSVWNSIGSHCRKILEWDPQFVCVRDFMECDKGGMTFLVNMDNLIDFPDCLSIFFM